MVPTGLAGSFGWLVPPSAVGTLVLTGATRRRAAPHTSSVAASTSILRPWVGKEETPPHTRWLLPGAPLEWVSAPRLAWGGTSQTTEFAGPEVGKFGDEFTTLPHTPHARPQPVQSREDSKSLGPGEGGMSG